MERVPTDVFTGKMPQKRNGQFLTVCGYNRAHPLGTLESLILWKLSAFDLRLLRAALQS